MVVAEEVDEVVAEEVDDKIGEQIDLQRNTMKPLAQ